MRVFEDGTKWSQEFLTSPEVREFQNHTRNLMKALVDKGCSVREVSHAFHSFVSEEELMLVIF